MLHKFKARLHHEMLIRLAQQIRFGQLSLQLPDGQKLELAGAQKGPSAELVLHDDIAVQALLKDGKLGFCEAVIDGHASSRTLPELIELATLHSSLLDQQPGLSRITPVITRLRHWFNRNNKTGSRRNIAYHYDLGNSFYKSWLDRTMTYSAAIFADEKTALSSAQTAKYERLADLADIQPGDRVLEIGCGWGGFAEYAAATRGARVTGITLSRAQHDFAIERLAAKGLDNKTEIRLQDYRDVSEKFDKICIFKCCIITDISKLNEKLIKSEIKFPLFKLNEDIRSILEYHSLGQIWVLNGDINKLDILPNILKYSVDTLNVKLQETPNLVKKKLIADKYDFEFYEMSRWGIGYWKRL